jgi:hypothetical protein
MKKLAVIAALAAVGLVAPAQAHKPDHAAGTEAKPAKAAAKAAAKAGKRETGKARRCAPRSVGFAASGALLGATLTPAAPGRLSGTITVGVTRADHGAPRGQQTFTLTNARVRFRAEVDAGAPAAGSRVKLGGKITKLTRKCPTAGFAPVVTVKTVDVKAAKTAGADEAKRAGADEEKTGGADEAETAGADEVETADADEAETADADATKKADA